MKIAMVGKGRMGSSLGAIAEKAGHQVIYATRDPSMPVLPAVQQGEVIFFALPYSSSVALAATPEIQQAASGKVLIDLCNAMTPDRSGLLLGQTSSAAEEIARRMPGARVVKAFNTIFAAVLLSRLTGAPSQAMIPFAGDDEAARKVVWDLVTAFGLVPVDCGPLKNARYIEPLGALNIELGLVQKRGTKIAFSFITVP